MNTNEIKKILKENNLWAKKRLGQNFLICDNVLKKIIKTAEIKKTDIVLEIGPGLGILTSEIAKRAKLTIAIEKDFKLVEFLRKKFKSEKNVKIVKDNVLFFDETGIKGNYKVVANLPYNITSPFLRKFLVSNHKPKEVVLMMQKEMAERITAKSGKRERGFLTVMVEFYAQIIEIIEIVDRDCFWPQPKVDSAIIKIRIKNNELRIKQKEEESFLKFVKIGFSQKRRQIHHPLISGLHLSKGEVFQILKKARIDKTKRAEDLSLKNWVQLYNQISLLQ